MSTENRPTDQSLTPVPSPIPLSPKVKSAIALLDSWLNDESGYDEENWPKLKAALEENRLSSRRLFDD
jgi:hypothetical protein